MTDVDEFTQGAVSICVAAMQAGWHVDWQGNEMRLTYPMIQQSEKE